MTVREAQSLYCQAIARTSGSLYFTDYTQVIDDVLTVENCHLEGCPPPVKPLGHLITFITLQ